MGGGAQLVVHLYQRVKKWGPYQTFTPLAVPIAFACDRESGSVCTHTVPPPKNKPKKNFSFLFSDKKNNKSCSDPVDIEIKRVSAFAFSAYRVSSNPTQKVLSKIRVLFWLITISFSHKLKPLSLFNCRYKKWRMATGIGSSNSNINRLYYLQAVCLNDVVLNTVRLFKFIIMFNFFSICENWKILCL